MKKILCFLLFALCLTVAANAQFLTYDFEDGNIPTAFTNDETYPWIVIDTTDESGNIIHCIRSGNRGVASSTSVIEITQDFAIDGYITFDALCRGEGYHYEPDDACIFYIDNEAQFTYGQSIAGWNHYAYIVSAGSHTFKWEYKKDGYINRPGDAFFVDNIEIGTGELCETPASLKLSRTVSSVKVSWQSIALNFTLRYRLVGTTTWTTVSDITETSYFLTGLSAGNYELQVAASCDLENWANTTYDFQDLFSTANWYAFGSQIFDSEGFYLEIPDEAGNETQMYQRFINFSTLAPEIIGTATSNEDRTIRAACYADGYVWSIKYFYDYESYEEHWNLCRAPLDKTTHTIGEFETVVTDFDMYEDWYNISAMAYNPLNRKIYYVVENNYDWPSVYSFKSFSLEDPATVSAEVSLSISPLALAFNPNGDAYCIEGGYPAKLYQLDMSDGSETLVGSLGKDLEGMCHQGMAFDMESGELFWAYWNILGTDESGLYKVNTNTADTSYLGQIGGGVYSAVFGMFKIWEGEFDACNVHYDLNVTPATTTATVDWTEKGDATSWVVAYKAADGTDFTEITVNETAYTLTGLTPETDYIVKVRSVCEGESILWSSYSFTTHGLCDDPTNLIATPDATTALLEWTGFQTEYNVRGRKIIYQSDFESDESLIGWRSLDQDNDGDNWELSNYGHSGQHCYRSFSWHDDWTPDPDNWLISPTIDLNGLMSVWISSGSNTYFDHFAIYVTTNPEWSGVSDFTQVVGETVAPAKWMEYTVDLSAYAGQRGAIAIRHFNSHDHFWLLLDDFSVYETIPEMTASDNSINLTGLDPESTYQVQVQGVCEDGVTEWSDPVEFTTAAATTEPCEISVINIEGFTVPEWGANPDYEVNVPENANYSLGGIFWNWAENEGTPAVLQATETFNNENANYYMVFNIIPNEGCSFAEDVTVMVDNNPSTILISAPFGDGYLAATQKFKVTEPTTEPCEISTIEIEGFTAPAWGAHPDLEVNVPEDAHYSLVYKFWKWYDADTHNSDFLTAEETFDNENYTYYMIFKINPNGCTISNDVTITINGNASLVYYNWNELSNEGRFYSIDFEIEEPTEEPTPCEISTIEIEGFTAPAWGAHPDFEVNVPEDAHYTLNNKFWKWYDAETHDGGFLTASETFDNENYTYYMIFKISPNGCTISDDVTITINEDESLVYFTLNELSSTGLFYSIEFEIEEPTEEPTPCEISTIEIEGFTAPAWGAHPDFEVNVPEDAHYTLNNKFWKWYDAETHDGGFLTASETFDNENYTYYMIFKISPNGCTISDDVTITINEDESLVYFTLNELSSTGLFYSIEFEIEEPTEEPIEPVSCDPAVDCEGHSYPTVNLGNVCWMTKNLDAEACVTVGNAYVYVSRQFPDEEANVAANGRLYDLAAAMQGNGAKAAVSTEGICPEGYTLPTTEQFEYLRTHYTADELRAGTGWIEGGSNGTGFSWNASGFRNEGKSRFENMLTEGYLWAVDMTGGTPQPAMYKMMYYCDEIVRVYDFDGISASIRCLRNPEE